MRNGNIRRTVESSDVQSVMSFLANSKFCKIFTNAGINNLPNSEFENFVKGMSKFDPVTSELVDDLIKFKSATEMEDFMRAKAPLYIKRYKEQGDYMEEKLRDVLKEVEKIPSQKKNESAISLKELLNRVNGASTNESVGLTSYFRLSGTEENIKAVLDDIGNVLYPKRVLAFDYNPETSILSVTSAVNMSVTEADVLGYCRVHNVEAHYSIRDYQPSKTVDELLKLNQVKQADSGEYDGVKL
ncbi:TPA: hypothetical protein SFZ43_000110 [Campylobacter jejuni]|nr:hypothetical protein [Campylobacter jejuni]